MEPILHGVAQQLFVSQFQGFQHQSAVGDVVDGVGAVDLLRQYASGQGSGQIEVRHQGQKFPVWVQGEADGHRQAAVYHGGGEAAVKGRGQVVRVAFHGVGDVQKTLGRQLVASQHIGTHGSGHQQSGGGAKAPANGDVSIDVDFHTPDFLTHGIQHGAVGGVGQVVRAGEFFVAAGDFQTGFRFFKGNVGVQAQSAAEGVKAGT